MTRVECALQLNETKSKRLVKAGGAGILSPTGSLNLLILLGAKNDESSRFAEVRYTAGTLGKPLPYIRFVGASSGRV